MSIVATERAAGVRPESPSRRRGASKPFNWPLVLLGYLLIGGVAIVGAIHGTGTTPLLNDPDDAMRLVTVRDLLNGQNWLDHLQHRLNTPFGAEIHWTHLIDAAIGGLILLFRPFAGPAMAETLAVYAWPLLLLAGLLVLSATIAYRLAGRAAILPALVIPAMSPVVMSEFSPGRIDHDSVQILLTLLMLWGTIEAIRRPRFSLLVGIAAALSLTVGIEGLPSVVCAVLGLALIWVVRPERADALRGFAVSFAAATVLSFVTAYPASRWFETACDEISIVYVAFAVGSSAALLLLATLPLRGWAPWQRLVLGGGLAVLLAAGLAAAFPLCLGGPYATLDPWLVHNWLDNVIEARTLLQSLWLLPPLTIGIVLPALLGLIVVGVRVWRHAEDRGAWLILGLFLLVAVLVMVVEVRGARLADPLAVAPGAWLILAARQRYLSGRQLSGALAMIGSWLGFAGLVIALGVQAAALPFGANTAADTKQAVSEEACRLPQAYTALAALPAARIMAQVDLGSHILLYTPHSVAGGPYHRDQAGVLDTFHFFNQPIAQARPLLAARGISLVVLCPALPETEGLADAAPDSFVKLFAANNLPSWLKQISLPGATLRIFAVAPQ